MCMLKGIYILKHSKVEPLLDHRGSARFNYRVWWRWVQRAGISGRQDVYSCTPALRKAALGMSWGSGGWTLPSVTLWLFLSPFVLLKAGFLARPVFPAMPHMG